MLFFIALLAVPASAGQARVWLSVNDQGAAALKQLVEDEIEWRTNLAKIAGQGLAVDGPVEVTPKGSFYEIKIRKLSTSLGPDRKLNIGTVVINAVPGNNGEWLLNAVIPSAVTLCNNANTPLAHISIGNQSLSGSWIPSAGVYPKADLLYQDIRITDLADKTFSGVISTAKLSSNLKSGSDGIWGGSGGFEMSGITIDTAGKDAVQTRIGRVVSENFYDRMDLSKTVENRQKIRDAVQPGKMPAESVKAALLSDAQGTFDSVRSSFSIHDIAVHAKDAQPPHQPMDMSVRKISFQGTLQGLQQEKASVTLKNSVQGLKIPAPIPDLAGLIPEDINIDIKINNLPARTIAGIIFLSLQDSPNAGLAALPEALIAAGTSLSIQDSFVRSRDLNSSIAGKISTTPNAVTGITGKMTLSIKGLEGVISKLQTLAIKPGADSQLVGYAGSLTAIMLIGQEGKSADGSKTNDYVLEMTQDGKLLLNNINIQSLVNVGETLNSHVNHDNPLVKRVAP